MGLSISKPCLGFPSHEPEPAGAGPGTSATPRRASGPPPRLNEKLKQLKKLGKSPNQELNRYADAAGKAVRKNLQPGKVMTGLDISNLPALAQAENARHPGLKLRPYASPGEFLANLASLPEGASRAIVRLAEPDGSPVKHHVMVDVRKEAGRAPTLLILEPSSINDNTFSPNLQFWNAMRGQRLDTSRVAVIVAEAQKSPSDCVMFCLNFAIKAMKNRNAFDTMHRDLAQRRGPGHALGRERHIAVAGGTLRHFSPQDLPGFLGNVAFAAGTLVLPPDFYKHATSAATARAVSEQAASNCAPGEAPATDRVNSTRHPAPESLEQRVAALTVTRPDRLGDLKTYSASIEGFRLQEIARAKRGST